MILILGRNDVFPTFGITVKIATPCTFKILSPFRGCETTFSTMAGSASNSSIQPDILAASQTEKSMEGEERHITEEAIITADWTPMAETVLRRK